MAIRDLIPWGRSRTPATRYESAQPFLTLHQEMNRLFDDFSRRFGAPGFGAEHSFGWPSVEMSETEKEIKIEAELPGLDDKDFELLLSDGALTIRGEKKSEREDESRHVSERFYGRFERQIPLPAEVESDKVSASFKKGVLTVNLPKSPEAVSNVKRITVSAK
ncbi:MAG TPA: Hsp20/alpha crystallin family protein [Alphaproteobacteria bacterium]|nr:Hsp20/alpha crystallin family protein [Alphaproteobacteria bacterium]